MKSEMCGGIRGSGKTGPADAPPRRATRSGPGGGQKVTLALRRAVRGSPTLTCSWLPVDDG
jgi:hypothetical protein